MSQKLKSNSRKGIINGVEVMEYDSQERFIIYAGYLHSGSKQYKLLSEHKAIEKINSYKKVRFRLKFPMMQFWYQYGYMCVTYSDASVMDDNKTVLKTFRFPNMDYNGYVCLSGAVSSLEEGIAKFWSLAFGMAFDGDRRHGLYSVESLLGWEKGEQPTEREITTPHMISSTLYDVSHENDGDDYYDDENDEDD